MKTKIADKLTPAEKAIRAVALKLPGATEEFPLGSRAFKVGGKAFVFLSSMEGVISLGTKLPKSHASALKHKFASPTHYGLGKHGWVTCEFQPNEKIPLNLLIAYVDESYPAVAPKRLLKELQTTN